MVHATHAPLLPTSLLTNVTVRMVRHMTSMNDPRAAKMTYAQIQATLARTEQLARDAQDVSQVLYDQAPGVYTEKTLTLVRDAIDLLTQVRRDLVKTSAADRTVSRRRIAEAAGLDLTTVQRWSKEGG